MKKSEEENLKEKTSAPKGTSYDPLDDEREESFRCLGVVAHEYRGIKKCYKEGTRLVSGVSFVQFTGTGHGSQYGQIVKCASLSLFFFSFFLDYFSLVESSNPSSTAR